MRAKYPTMRNAVINRLLGEHWNTLDAAQKAPYYAMAESIRDNHQLHNIKSRYRPRKPAASRAAGTHSPDGTTAPRSRSNSGAGAGSGVAAKASRSRSWHDLPLPSSLTQDGSRPEDWFTARDSPTEDVGSDSDSPMSTSVATETGDSISGSSPDAYNTVDGTARRNKNKHKRRTSSSLAATWMTAPLFQDDQFSYAYGPSEVPLGENGAEHGNECSCDCDCGEADIDFDWNPAMMVQADSTALLAALVGSNASSHGELLGGSLFSKFGANPTRVPLSDQDKALWQLLQDDAAIDDELSAAAAAAMDSPLPDFDQDMLAAVSNMDCGHQQDW